MDKINLVLIAIKWIEYKKMINIKTIKFKMKKIKNLKI